MGTMGATMVLNEPPPNRRAMLRIGLAGPLAGLLVTLPALLYGLSRSSVGPLPSEGGYLTEGNSLLYLALKALVHGCLLPSGGVDVDLHPLAFVGWSGLLMTGVNLLPIGQLDGGHILSAWLGQRARWFIWPILVALLLLGIWWRGWLLWAALAFLLSRGQVEPLDGISTLRRGDIALAIVVLVLFALLFTPIPLRIV
jgi:membrane-associated protease RseP (regulator of RpoE activity)